MRKKLIGLLACLFCAGVVSAELRLPSVFSDHMVLQSGRPVAVWGTADAGAAVTVGFSGQKKTAVADSSKHWKIVLDPMSASSEPRKLIIRSSIGNQQSEINDVLVGEVWLASGQSNMDFTFRRLGRQNEAAAQPENNLLRLFNTPHAVSSGVKEDAGGQWGISRPSALMDFSAVAYYFASRLQADRQVPVGIIVSAWGGTKIEAWTPLESLKTFPELRESLMQYERMVADPFARARLSAQQEAWQDLSYQDPGNRGFLYGYADPDADVTDWKSVPVPGTVEKILGESKDGAFWFRRTVRVPEAWIGEPLTLQLGVIDDLDETYVNGIPVGSTGRETTGFWMAKRSYPVPGYAVRGTELTLAVRVFDMANAGGFMSPSADLKIYPAGCGQEAIALAGDWAFKAEYVFNDDDPLRTKFNRRWGVPDTPRGPSNLYNAMIAPFTPFSLNGVIWYQGESNADDPALYSRLFPTMIDAWRRKWNRPELPFIYVELAAFRAKQTQPCEENGWARQREAQRAALTLPQTAVASAIDIGSETDIHPKDKKTVGDRLALAAAGLVYGESGLWESPQYAESVIKDGRVHLSFRFADGGLELRGGTEPKSFAICGTDQLWHWAQARIDGERIVVWNPDVPNPVAVRYAWANHPEINVYSRAGLPLLPFRTDKDRK